MIIIQLDPNLKAADLQPQLARVFAAAPRKIRAIDHDYPLGSGAPVFTVAGRYTARGWTEWTQGFQYGSALLLFDATGDEEFLQLGRENTRHNMAGHVTHVGVHDHGFNNVSTYGNLLRLAREGKIAATDGDVDFYSMALKCSGVVQAVRWTPIADGRGYIYSFNGPHSLFADTIRSLRALAVAHELGQSLMMEQDANVSLLERLLHHAGVTADYAVFYGEGRDSYDLHGRVAHESIFNTNNGVFRCPNSQQGYSPFSTWTRGLAWIMCGFAEELEFIGRLDDAQLAPFGGRARVNEMLLRPALASCDFYIEHTPIDGIPYWDTGAPGLAAMGDYLERPAEPYNDHEPVDSSAAAIGSQGLLRLGRFLQEHGDRAKGDRYWQAGLQVLKTLFDEPYLSEDPAHQGLLLHSIYHRPNGWDHVPEGSSIPCGEASMWGDYHALEVALYLQRILNNEPYYTFAGPG